MRFDLIPHAAHPARAVAGVAATLERRSPSTLFLGFEIRAEVARLVLPPPALPQRADRLWETTCFELFLRPVETGGYREFNFAPSRRWAAYDFSAYRAGAVHAGLPAPPSIEIAVEVGEGKVRAAIALSLDLDREPYRLGLCAVVEETDGAKSYWALNHGDAVPDFHHPACFGAELPPAPRA